MSATVLIGVFEIGDEPSGMFPECVQFVNLAVGRGDLGKPG